MSRLKDWSKEGQAKGSNNREKLGNQSNNKSENIHNNKQQITFPLFQTTKMYLENLSPNHYRKNRDNKKKKCINQNQNQQPKKKWEMRKRIALLLSKIRTLTPNINRTKSKIRDNPKFNLSISNFMISVLSTFQYLINRFLCISSQNLIPTDKKEYKWY